jgi:hypothetical protein
MPANFDFSVFDKNTSDQIEAQLGLKPWKKGDIRVDHATDKHAYFDGANWVDMVGAAPPVTSVFGRIGDVVAAANDYAHSQLSGVTIDQHHARDHSIVGATHTGFPGGGTTFLRDDATFAAPPGSTGAPVFTTVEKDLGVPARRAGRFLVTTSGLTSGKPVSIHKANGPYTGKGTRVDEAEMDEVVAQGKTISATQIEVFWQSRHGPIRGNVKFDYFVGA